MLFVCDFFFDFVIFVCDFSVISREVYEKKSVICPSDPKLLLLLKFAKASCIKDATDGLSNYKGAKRDTDQARMTSSMLL